MSRGLPARLDTVLKRCAASAREIDRLAGLTVGHTKLIATGVKPNPETATIAALAITLGFSLDWLILGRGKQPTEEQVVAAVAEARLRPLAVQTKIARALGVGRKSARGKSVPPEAAT